MSTNTPADSQPVKSKFDIEFHCNQIEAVGSWLITIANLMAATDPEQTDGHRDVPILHGIGSLLDSMGNSLRTHANEIVDHQFRQPRSAKNG